MKFTASRSWRGLIGVPPFQRVRITCECCKAQTRVAEPHLPGDEVEIVCPQCETPLTATVLPL